MKFISWWQSASTTRREEAFMVGKKGGVRIHSGGYVWEFSEVLGKGHWEMQHARMVNSSMLWKRAECLPHYGSEGKVGISSLYSFHTTCFLFTISYWHASRFHIGCLCWATTWFEIQGLQFEEGSLLCWLWGYLASAIVGRCVVRLFSIDAATNRQEPYVMLGLRYSITVFVSGFLVLTWSIVLQRTM